MRKSRGRNPRGGLRSPVRTPRKGYDGAGQVRLRALAGDEVVAGVERLDLGERHVVDPTGAVRRAVNRRVVEHDELAVGGRVDVDLEHVGAEPQRPLVGVHRVRGHLVLAALMGDVERPQPEPVGRRRGGRGGEHHGEGHTHQDARSQGRASARHRGESNGGPKARRRLRGNGTSAPLPSSQSFSRSAARLAAIVTTGVAREHRLLLVRRAQAVVRDPRAEVVDVVVVGVADHPGERARQLQVRAALERGELEPPLPAGW